MIVASLCAATGIMLVAGLVARGVYLWSHRDQIRQELAAARLAQIRHEVDMRGLEDALRVRYQKVEVTGGN